MNSIITVGITGGMGTGKSLICRMLNIMGYPVFYSDTESKALLNDDPVVISELKTLFGDHIFSNNSIQRELLAKEVFNSTEKLNALNAILHPRVRNKFDEWKKMQSSNLVFNEAAILFETGSYKNFDFTILVTAPEDIRIERIQNRDHLSIEQIKARMSNQWPDEQKIPLADFVVINDEKNLLLPQINEILAKLNKS